MPDLGRRARTQRNDHDNTPDRHDARTIEQLEPRTLLSSLPILSMEVTDPTATEAGPNAGSIVVTRTGGAIEQPLTFSYNLLGTAQIGVDYLPIDAEITIPAGRNSVTIPIIPINDLIDEDTEAVRFVLERSENYTRAPGSRNGEPSQRQGVVNIFDNDNGTIVEIFSPDKFASEATGDGARFVLRREGTTLLPTTVTLRWSGSATHGEDFTGLQTQVTIPIGRQAVSIPISPIADAHFEGDETVRVFIVEDQVNYSVDTQGAKNRSHVFIIDKPLVTMFVADPVGSTFPQDTASFVFKRTGDLSQRLNLSTRFTGAINGFDFERVGPLSFEPGRSQITVVIRGRDTPLMGGVESKILTLSLNTHPTYNLVGAIEGVFARSITILSDPDPA